MPKMKYFQPLADMKRHFYSDINRCHPLINYTLTLEQSKEYEQILDYLLGCQIGIAYNESLVKPLREDVIAFFKKHLSYLINERNVTEETLKKHKKNNPLIVKEYLTCIHYLEKLEDLNWWDKLPLKIKNYDEKYSTL